MTCAKLLELHSMRLVMTTHLLKGMNEHYGLNCFDDGPIDLCKNGRLLVNMIRCIGRDDYSVSNNSCRGAWISYTLKLAHFFTNELKKTSDCFLQVSRSLA